MTNTEVALTLDYLRALSESVQRRYIAGSDISSIECDRLLGEIISTAQELRSHVDDLWREAREAARRTVPVPSPRQLQPQRAKSIDDLLSF
jgi:hypothetical protein